MGASLSTVHETAAPAKPGRWGVLVIFNDGSMEYMKQGVLHSSAPVARFRTKRTAIEQRDFLRLGLDGDPDTQSVNAVKLPRWVR